MDMSGSYVIPARRQAVWDGLNDIDILRQAIPGCDEITKLSDTELEATVSAKVGPVKAKFKGSVTLSEIDPPNGYRISGEGKGGAAGFAKGGAKVTLADAADGTELSYTVDASVGGKLAQIGGRLIDSTAKKMADDFFTRFSDLVADTAEAPISEPTPTPPPSETLMPTDTAPSNEPKAVDPLLTHTPITFMWWVASLVAIFGALAAYTVLLLVT